MGLSEVAGYYANLERGFAELGVDSLFVSKTAHDFQYDDKIRPLFIRWVQKIGSYRSQASRYPVLVRILLRAIHELQMFVVFIWAAFTCDAFIFSFGKSFFNYYDLPILRFLKKRIVFMFHGSDSRPPYLDGIFVGEGKKASPIDLIRLAKKRKDSLRSIEKWSHVMVDHPPMALFHEREFVLVHSIGLPLTCKNEIARSKSRQNEDEIIILHASSDPIAKGTHIITRSIESLKLKGLKISFVLLTGASNSVVLQEIERCDFVVDQLYSDTPMATFALEAACAGKPAVVGGYYADFIAGDIPVQLIPPSLFCHPDNIEEAIEKMVLDRDYRREMGNKAREFVETQWRPIQVAERFMRLVNGDIPTEWFYDPQRIRYCRGMGASEGRIKEVITAILTLAGTDALQLADKLEVQRNLLEFAGMPERS
jgi:hypothetical protein